MTRCVIVASLLTIVIGGAINADLNLNGVFEKLACLVIAISSAYALGKIDQRISDIRHLKSAVKENTQDG